MKRRTFTTLLERCGYIVAARGAHAAVSIAGDRISQQPIARRLRGSCFGRFVPPSVEAMQAPNFAILDSRRPEVAMLTAAMLQARDAIVRKSWSHPEEPTSDEWWADVLADPRARSRPQSHGLYGCENNFLTRRPYYTLGDENHEIIFVACRKCEWKAAFVREELIATHGR